MNSAYSFKEPRNILVLPFSLIVRYLFQLLNTIEVATKKKHCVLVELERIITSTVLVN